MSFSFINVWTTNNFSLTGCNDLMIQQLTNIHKMDLFETAVRRVLRVPPTQELQGRSVSWWGGGGRIHYFPFRAWQQVTIIMRNSNKFFRSTEWPTDWTASLWTHIPFDVGPLCCRADSAWSYTLIILFVRYTSLHCPYVSAEGVRE